LKRDFPDAAEAKERQREAQSRGGRTPTGMAKIPQKIEESKKEQVSREAVTRAAQAAKTNRQYVSGESRLFPTKTRKPFPQIPEGAHGWLSHASC